jgi:hypothetical protein
MEGYEAFRSVANTSFSDGYNTINEIVVEDDKVMVWTT